LTSAPSTGHKPQANGDGAGGSAGEPLSAQATGVSTGSLLHYSYTKQWYDKNNDYTPGVQDNRDYALADTQTTNSYQFWDGAVQAGVTLVNRDGTSVSAYAYDLTGHVLSVGGPRAHVVSFTKGGAKLMRNVADHLRGR
jgi:hypothetical protein